jgi:hypothetical protein
MSTTIAHRPHVHIQIPWTAVAVLMAAAALAAIVLVWVDQPWESGQTSGTATTTATAEEAVAVQKPASHAQLRAYVDAARQADEAAAASTTRLNLVEGISLDAPSTWVAQPLAPYYAPGTAGIDNPRPLNFVAGAPR